MIDFKKKRYMGISSGNRVEDFEVLEQYAATVRKDLADSKQNFFWLGVHLIALYDSNTYSVTFDCEKLGVSYLYDNCCAECFFAYCYDEFGLDKTQVSRLMNIVDEFGDGLRCFKKEWEDFGYSQLCELLPLSADERKPVQPDWTIKRIREYKKSLSDKQTVSASDAPDAEQPPESKYARFEKWTKRDLCDKIFDLEKERELLVEKIQTLVAAALAAAV